jgi:hypothetical protein
MKLWLDDERNPLHRGLEGWTWVKTVEEAIALVERSALWEEASLDHDLGACEPCVKRAENDDQARGCRHVKNGYDFVLWMAEHGKWPTEKPQVHSMNPVGRIAMTLAIERYFPGE